MPQQERDRYQQRYQQWRQLSPEERRRMENNLSGGTNLSPQERDSIRRASRTRTTGCSFLPQPHIFFSHQK